LLRVRSGSGNVSYFYGSGSGSGSILCNAKAESTNLYIFAYKLAERRHGSEYDKLKIMVLTFQPIRILLFSSLTFKMPAKTNLKKKFFCILLFEDTFTSFFKAKRQKVVTKQ
jgi:hypothetical protein